MLLAGCGLALVIRPLMRYPGSVNAGAILLVAGLLLAFAAETGGLGPNSPVRGDLFDPDYFTAHGGVLGESLYWASTTLFQRVGAHIIAVLMILSGILLLSGRPLVSLLSSGAEAAGTGPRRDRRDGPHREGPAGRARGRISTSATAGRPSTSPARTRTRRSTRRH